MRKVVANAYIRCRTSTAVRENTGSTSAGSPGETAAACLLDRGGACWLFMLRRSGKLINTMVTDRGWRRDDKSRQRRRELYMAVRGWLLVAVFLVSGSIALATGQPGSGQAAMVIGGVCAALLVAGWLRNRRHRQSSSLALGARTRALCPPGRAGHAPAALLRGS